MIKVEVTKEKIINEIERGKKYQSIRGIWRTDNKEIKKTTRRDEGRKRR